MRCLLKESAAQKPQQFVGPRLCGTGGRAVASILERSPCYQSSRDEARSTHANRLGKNSAGQKRHTRSGHHGVESFLLQSIIKLTTSRGSWKPFPRPHALSGFPSSARTHPSPRSKPVLRKHFREGVRVWFSKDREPSQIAKVIPFHI